MYDYLVDRDVTWDASEERHTRKWEIVCKAQRPEGFIANNPGLPFTEMLVSFDLRYKYAHIPHPYPLLPYSTQSSREQSTRKALFGGFKKAKAAASRDPKDLFQTSLAFSGATNISKFGVTFDGIQSHLPRYLFCPLLIHMPDNEFVDALSTYEKTTHLNGVTPLHARLGRWLLLYPILQVLSIISVDTAGLKYRDKVSYFLCPRLEGCPPWRRHGLPHPYVEACQRRSYCWVAPQMWGRPGSELPMLLEDEGVDGTESLNNERDGGSDASAGFGRVDSYVGRPGTLKPELPLRSSRRVSTGMNDGKGRSM